MILKYVSSNGTAFDLLSWDGLKAESADFHKYKWASSVTKKQYGEIVNYFTKAAHSYKATFCFRGSPASRRAKIDAFHFCTEYDIAHQTPGRIYWGSDYIECYIIESDTIPKKKYEQTYTENSVVIYCPYPFWIEEQTLSINPINGSSSSSETDKGYDASYPYSYSYAPSPTAQFMHIDHYADSNFKLIVYGPTDEVSITIADHLYKVNHALTQHQYMVIDSRETTSADKRCYMVNAQGVETNVFNDRDESSALFQKIPSGDIIIDYARTYGIELTVYKERSEPRVANDSI